MGFKRVNSLMGFPAFTLFFLLSSQGLKGQEKPEYLSDSVTVRDCISYAMKHQPLVKQLKIDEEIAERDIKISLSDWYPQITSNAGFQHYLEQPVSLFPNLSDPAGPKIQITSGVQNNSNIQFNANQKIFSNDLIFAGKTAKYYRQEASQTSQKSSIELVVEISKAFYDVLLTQQMLNIINDDIDRLSKSLNDALSLYNNGVRDKIDFSRATLSLNAARSQKITVANSIIAKMTYLKQLMGYPEGFQLALRNNFNEMREEIMIDTLQGLQYRDRIEYQLLQTNLRLEKLSIGYYKQNFLPSLSAYATYNINYQNDNLQQLYNNTYPNSLVGINLSFPLFEGTKRIQNLKKSRLVYDRLVLDTLNLINEMNTGYSAALAAYKSSLAAYNLTDVNITIAKDVYNAVLSQYKEGIKPYLEVIISETDLRNAELNNLSSLILLMFSKIDMEQALGKISIGY